MTKPDDEIHLLHCLTLIENKLNRGPREGWSNYDFDRLIEDIQVVTGVRLSLTTLKRVSGRIKYDSFPTHTTLNALARYVGFEDWREFVRDQERSRASGGESSQSTNASSTVSGETSTHNDPSAAVQQDQRETTTSTVSARTRLYTYRRVMWLAAAVPLLLAVYLLIASRKKTHLDSSQFSFRADKMYTVGVPNSVVFHYDASKVPSDSVFIVQTWDMSRKTYVDREKHEHSAIYYYPGYFRTKLIVDGEIVKTHDLQIATDGWLCLVQQEPQPLYFSKDEVEHGDSITVGLETLKKYNLEVHPAPPLIRMFNESDMGSIMNDNFVFETELKNPFNEGSNPCQFVQVLIQSKDDVMIIPLSARACVGDLFLYAYGYGVNSKHADLSGFGVDLTKWVKLRVESENKHVKFIVNGKTVYEVDFPDEPKGVVGVQFRFWGPASVRSTKFETKDSVYQLTPSRPLLPLQ
ncbi:hypothetical protein WBG78_02990 [Chryseolinea sp. T2]|uniref:hypothetical protein n=1 Tax=Chryseolinea sp. T2 TaxID=3129255 RepID=UPI0030771A6F